MKTVLKYLKPHIPRMSLGLTIKFFASILELVLPWILSHLIDVVIPMEDVPAIYMWGGVMILASVLAAVTNITANRMAARVSQRTIERLRHDLFASSFRLSCAQVDKFTIPSLESRLTSDTYNIHHMIGMMQRIGIRAPILLIGGIVVTFSLDPVLTVVLLCTLPFIGVTVFTISRKVIPLFRKLQESIDSMVRVTRENITGIRVIKALSKTDYETERFSEANREVIKRDRKGALMTSLTNPVVNFFLNAGLVAVIIVGAYRVDAGLSQAGKIVAFLSYFTIIMNALMSINRIFMMFSRGAASAHRIEEVINAPDDLLLEPEDIRETDNHVEFSDVSFSYKGSNQVVKNISFSLKKGETLGIIGATGSGKSTLFSLLMRLYDPVSGEIRIDGKKVSGIPSEELNTKFGVVFQGDVIFADTVYENIDFGRNLSKEAVEKAAHCAQATEFISALENGFEHKLSYKGTNLSGGQKQRLLIARALAGAPEILLLDDSSSALDYKTDSLLRQSLKKEYGNITTLIIAQRVSSIAHADRILVLDKGKTVGYGTHNELMETCPIYSEIAQSQLGDSSFDQEVM